MLRLHKKEHLLKNLYYRELGSVCSSYKMTLNIMRQLLASEERTFYKTWEMRSRKRIVQGNGKLILNNYSEILSFWGKDNIPSKCFKIDNIHSQRIVDVLQCSMGYFRQDTGNPTSIEGYYLTLSDNNWLCSYHCETGKLQTEVYLGSYENNFKHCDWNIYRQQITVMTNIGKQNVYIAVFTVSPLEFKALLLVNKSVFTNQRCSKINVSDGLLIVGIGSCRNGSVRIYDFDAILDMNTEFRATKLFDECPLRCPCDRIGINGTYNHGLPVNCTVKQVPPALFEVNNCANLSVDFGGNPWHYIIASAFRNISLVSSFDVRRVFDHSLATNRTLIENNTAFPQAKAYFHYDDSGRIVHVLPHIVNIYKLIPTDDVSILELATTMNLATDNVEHKSAQYCKKPSMPKMEDQPSTSRRPQRTIRLESSISESLAPLKTVLAVDYENELDLNVILGYDPDYIANPGWYENPCALVNFYDNFDGRLVKSVKLLEIRLDNCDDYDINMEVDTLIITARNNCDVAIYESYVYKFS